ncbi:hypothetical protein TNCV_4355751 [Trichonephila clavipes]|nr:hypothetical protein TNCV_4355751 [Trichonephila clavipes]
MVQNYVAKSPRVAEQCDVQLRKRINNKERSRIPWLLFESMGRQTHPVDLLADMVWRSEETRVLWVRTAALAPPLQTTTTPFSLNRFNVHRLPLHQRHQSSSS